MGGRNGESGKRGEGGDGWWRAWRACSGISGAALFGMTKRGGNGRDGEGGGERQGEERTTGAGRHACWKGVGRVFWN